MARRRAGNGTVGVKNVPRRGSPFPTTQMTQPQCGGSVRRPHVPTRSSDAATQGLLSLEKDVRVRSGKPSPAEK